MHIARIALLTFSISTQLHSQNCGDCNADGAVTITDVLAAAQHAAGVNRLTGTLFDQCNVVGLLRPEPTGAVNVLDALEIARFQVGLVQDMDCLSDPEWVETIPTGTLPRARTEHSMCWDSTNSRVLLFGGFGGYALNDLWSWDGASWTRIYTVNIPLPRQRAGFVFDEARGVAVLFGGHRAGHGDLNDLWEFDGQDWSNRTLPTGPPASVAPAVVYHPLWQETMIHSGGVPGAPGSFFAEFDLWNGQGWASMWNLTRPESCSHHEMVYDPNRGVMVTFGGRDDPGQSNFSDTWELDGQGWHRFWPISPAPALQDYSMCYHEGLREVVVFGGSTGDSHIQAKRDTWHYDDDTWFRSDVGIKPLSRVGGEMVYDRARGECVLFGGTALSGARLQDTWVYTTSR